jgi:urea transport system ATP-binding protein
MMLEVEDLRAAYGRIPILDGVSLAVADGEFVGFLPATGGRVRFAGGDITGAPPYARARLGIGYVPQGREIFPGLSVFDNLRMGCAKERGDERAVIDAVLGDFPRLRPLLERAGGALSGGEQQLLAIARSLCGKPRLLLLDEPTEGIQPSIIDEIVETLRRLRDKTGLTIILVEQNLDFIAALSQRVLIIQKGSITQEVRPSDLGDADVVGEFVGITA